MSKTLTNLWTPNKVGKPKTAVSKKQTLPQKQQSKVKFKNIVKKLFVTFSGFQTANKNIRLKRNSSRSNIK